MISVTILYEVDKAVENIQHMIKWIIDRYSDICKLVLCCEDDANITGPVKNRFKVINVDAPETHEVSIKYFRENKYINIYLYLYDIHFSIFVCSLKYDLLQNNVEPDFFFFWLCFATFQISEIFSYSICISFLYTIVFRTKFFSCHKFQFAKDQNFLPLISNHLITSKD